MKHPVLDCLLIIALVLSALVFLVIVIWPFRFIVGIAAIIFEPELVKANMDNPYVDENYPGWKNIQIEDSVHFSIPESWEIYKENGVCTIVDSSGSIWAYGATVGKNDCTFAGYTSYYRTILSVDPTDIEFEPFIGSRNMDGSYFTEVLVYHNDGVESVHCAILFLDMDSDYVLLLQDDLGENEQALDLAEALMYSYAFDR